MGGPSIDFLFGAKLVCKQGQAMFFIAQAHTIHGPRSSRRSMGYRRCGGGLELNKLLTGADAGRRALTAGNFSFASPRHDRNSLHGSRHLHNTERSLKGAGAGEAVLDETRRDIYNTRSVVPARYVAPFHCRPSVPRRRFNPHSDTRGLLSFSAGTGHNQPWSSCPPLDHPLREVGRSRFCHDELRPARKSVSIQQGKFYCSHTWSPYTVPIHGALSLSAEDMSSPSAQVHRATHSLGGRTQSRTSEYTNSQGG